MTIRSREPIIKILAQCRAFPPQSGSSVSEARAEFWKAVCTSYGVRARGIIMHTEKFFTPNELDTQVLISETVQRELLTNILLEHDPEMAKVLNVQTLPLAAITTILQGLIAKHVFSPESLEDVKPTGRPNKFEDHLRVYSLLETMKHEEGISNTTYHWQPKDKIRQLLRENPDLSPSKHYRANNAPENAIHSQYRKDCIDIENKENARQHFHRDKWKAFMSRLDDRTAEWVVRLCELFVEIPDKCGGDVEALDSMICQWKALAVMALPEATLKRFIQLELSEKESRLIVGWQLQKNAVKTATEKSTTHQSTKRFYSPPNFSRPS